MSQGSSGPAPRAPPPKGKSKGLDIWRKQQAKLADPDDEHTADVVDLEDAPSGAPTAPGLSFDPKGRHTPLELLEVPVWLSLECSAPWAENACFPEHTECGFVLASDTFTEHSFITLFAHRCICRI